MDIENEKLERETGLIYGRNAVLAALESDQAADKLYISAGETGGSLGRIIGLAKERGLPVKDIDRRKMDLMTGGGAHQGVALQIAAAQYSEMEDIYRLAEQRGEPLFVIVADGIEDPHNLGALIRTAECSGAHGVIIPRRRSASLSPSVYKASAGAASILPVVRVANLASTIDDLKADGVWVYCAEKGGKRWDTADYSGKVALVIGSEGEGVSRLIREKSDFVVSLPLMGKTTSLNASVAGGIIMYEILKQRMSKNR